MLKNGYVAIGKFHQWSVALPYKQRNETKAYGSAKPECDSEAY